MSFKSDSAVLILGGGIVGLSLGLLLARQGIPVTLIEANVYSALGTSSSVDIRCSTLSRSSEQVLTEIGLWQDPDFQARLLPYEDMYVWDAQGTGHIAFSAAEIAEPNLGYVIKNQYLLAGLLRLADQQPNLQILTGVRPDDLQCHPDGVTCALSNGDTLYAAVCVGADGARSWLREYLQIPSYGWDYQQSALTALVEMERPHEDTAWQCFLPEGPLALLPVERPRLVSVVWTATRESIISLQGLDETAFNESLTEALESRFGAMRVTSQRLAFPLQMLHAKHYVRERAVLVGDAAHQIHPLAGQGLNIGFRDIALLARLWGEAYAADRDLGQLTCLRQYERARRGDVQAMILSVEFFKQLFGQSFPIIKGLRNFGLKLTNNMTWAKKIMMRQALGIS